MVLSIPKGLVPVSFILLASAEAQVTFTYMKAEDLVVNHLLDPNSSIRLRNVETSDNKSCYALFANGHGGSGGDSNGGGLKGSSTTGQSGGGDEDLNGIYDSIPNKAIVLGTGHPFFGLLDSDGNSAGAGPVDAELKSLLENEEVYDPCYLQFEFQCLPPPAAPAAASSSEPPDDDNAPPPPPPPTINVNYVFGSEEYFDERDDRNDDAFGAFLNGDNIALVPGGDGGPITVGNVDSRANSEHYIDNAEESTVVEERSSPYPGIEAGGFTTKLSASAETREGWNVIKFVVGDAGDATGYSWTLLEAGSFACSETAPAAPATAAPTNDDAETTDNATETTTTASSESRYYRNAGIPMDVAVAVAVCLGIVALAMPILCLTVQCKKRAPAVVPAAK